MLRRTVRAMWVAAALAGLMGLLVQPTWLETALADDNETAADHPAGGKAKPAFDRYAKAVRSAFALPKGLAYSQISPQKQSKLDALRTQKEPELREALEALQGTGGSKDTEARHKLDHLPQGNPRGDNELLVPTTAEASLSPTRVPSTPRPVHPPPRTRSMGIILLMAPAILGTIPTMVRAGRVHITPGVTGSRTPRFRSTRRRSRRPPRRNRRQRPDPVPRPIAARAAGGRQNSGTTSSQGHTSRSTGPSGLTAAFPHREPLGSASHRNKALDFANTQAGGQAPLLAENAVPVSGFRACWAADRFLGGQWYRAGLFPPLAAKAAPIFAAAPQVGLCSAAPAFPARPVGPTCAQIYNGHGTAEQWIRERAKPPSSGRKLSYRTLKDNQTRWQLFALACNLTGGEGHAGGETSPE